MGFLDFIKRRNASEQQAVAEKPQSPKLETAREMYAREAAHEKAKPIEQMSTDQTAKVDAIKATLERATRHQGAGDGPSPALAGGTTSPQPMRQNMTGQDRAAPGLSPTSGQVGQPATEKSVQPAKTPERQQTVPRTRPSWER